MFFSSFTSSSGAVEIVHCPDASDLPHDPQQRLVSEFASSSTILRAGYAAPFGHNGILQTIASSVKGEQRAFPAHPEKTYHLEFADGGNTKIQVSVGDDAPEDIPTYIGVHGMAGTSLGGVITAKALGKWGEDCPVSAAALINPVYDFAASCKATESNLVSRTVFNPAVGAFYAKLVKKNKDAFDLDHWTHTRPKPFPPTTLSPLSSSPFPPSVESRPLAQESRNSSFMTSSTRSTSIFSSLPSPSTPGTSSPPTPSPGTSLCLSPPQTTSSVIAEYTPEIKEALGKSLKKVTSSILPQPLTKFCKNFVASTAHFLCGEEFMAETSAVNDLPGIRVPCLAVNCADDPLMPGKDLPRSEARKSPFVLMAIPKKGGHLGTFTTKKWRKRHGHKRFHTAVVEEWFKANEALPQMRPRPAIINAHQGFFYPQGHPEMAFRETTAMYLKLKYTRPTYPNSGST
ncbi:hypothetical protein M407DRAFT_11509 [Tulasnella calospora MUT 4182]|uniref:AB hydrolase-1 domain-containing protein n=1 Tax=Tulasnella calospora MUT 4182 TaxID=1051891 RepID=A0A0C3Q647_9AGAM|nr:hypothetical protein M407DRAFT_11509 [Tulasnella calospora MUT 4182]